MRRAILNDFISDFEVILNIPFYKFVYLTFLTEISFPSMHQIWCQKASASSKEIQFYFSYQLVKLWKGLVDLLLIFADCFN